MKRVIVIVVIILFPIILNQLIFDNDVPSKVSNDGWVSFLGCYIGALIGFFTTLENGVNLERVI